MEFEVPKELMERQLQFLKKVSETGRVKIGVNEVTKAVEREKAKLVLIAQDVDPKEIVMHLPLLCKEKKIPYSFVSAKKELGENAGIEVGTATVAVTEEGKDGKKELLDIAKKLSQLGGVRMEGVQAEEAPVEKGEEKEGEERKEKEEKEEKIEEEKEEPKEEKLVKEEEKEKAGKERKEGEGRKEEGKEKKGKEVKEEKAKEEGKEEKVGEEKEETEKKGKEVEKQKEEKTEEKKE